MIFPELSSNPSFHPPAGHSPGRSGGIFALSPFSRLSLIVSLALLWGLTACDLLFPPSEDKPRFGSVSGLVLSHETELPISGAIVEALENQVADTTNSLGAFLLDSLAIGVDTLIAAAAYYDTQYQAFNVVEEPQETTFWLDVDSELGCIPVEDTGRVYISPNSGEPMPIYPWAVYARFYPWVADTNQIKQVADKYNLTIKGFSGIDQQWAAILCITDESRAECHFTPYGKEGFENFGADSLVEYAFGVFSWGYIYLSGNIRFSFTEETSQARIDSFFAANGLRFLYTRPNIPTGLLYVTLITPEARKNVLDLGDDLKTVPFVESISVELWSGGDPVQCN